MTDQHYDAIIVGSGAGGTATAFNLVRAGKRALVSATAAVRGHVFGAVGAGDSGHLAGTSGRG